LSAIRHQVDEQVTIFEEVDRCRAKVFDEIIAARALRQAAIVIGPIWMVMLLSAMT